MFTIIAIETIPILYKYWDWKLQIFCPTHFYVETTTTIQLSFFQVLKTKSIAFKCCSTEVTCNLFDYRSLDHSKYFNDVHLQYDFSWEFINAELINYTVIEWPSFVTYYYSFSPPNSVIYLLIFVALTFGSGRLNHFGDKGRRRSQPKPKPPIEWLIGFGSILFLFCVIVFANLSL
jgi:hypothetical protein